LSVLVFSLSGTNFPEVFYTNNSYGNSRNPFRRSLSVCSRSGRRRADARVRLTLAHSRASRRRGGVLKRYERSVRAKIARVSHRSRSSAWTPGMNIPKSCLRFELEVYWRSIGTIRDSGMGGRRAGRGGGFRGRIHEFEVTQARQMASQTQAGRLDRTWDTHRALSGP
jgi:hypothetical protein